MVEKMVERIELMRKAAQFVINKQLNPSQWQVDELVNHAWLNSIHRVSDYIPDSMIFSLCRQSMFQYICGKRSTKYEIIREMDIRSVSIHGDYEDRDWQYIAEEEKYSYDDVDEAVTFITKLPLKKREMVIMLLHGYLKKDIAKHFGVSPPRVSGVFSEIKKGTDYE